MELTDLLSSTIQNKASDLFLSAGLPPLLRVDGDIRKMDGGNLTSGEIEKMLNAIMNEGEKERLKQASQVDFAFGLQRMARFRINVFRHARGIGAAFRALPSEMLSFEALGAPKCFLDIVNKPNGLVLVTGPTGSGKSTTLASMIDYINQHKNLHILTVEDPIEFIHECKLSLVHQREVLRDVPDFSSALRVALRENPDIILVGEMRDLETIRLALTAAETGHLVFATLHTSSAAKTVDRIIDVFPAGEKNMVRSMLSEALQAVIAQTLLKKVGGGRVAVFEILLATPAIRNLIREDKVAQMYSVIQTSAGIGMQTLDQALVPLVRKGVIRIDEARTIAVQKELFRIN
ncbi:MAG: type IV pilus twitching motility protein PilT [Gammaproteobacteria bacterium]|nr:type IV pilus twitching motility protein PilT [Gammaproteobacteria bacterium]